MSIKQRQVHLDFHTSEHIPSIGVDFKKEEFASQLKKAHVDSITCFARCHHGWLYYPSKKYPELIHPQLKNKNLLLEQIEACHEVGIDVPIYTTVQWDGLVAREHPEWLAIDGNGEPMNSQGVPDPHFYYTLCLNSDYRDYFKEHLLDIIETVQPENIDGIFMDILFKVNCHCEKCQSEMAKHGIVNDSDVNRLKYSEIMLSEFKDEISALIWEKIPGTGIFYNGSHVGFADKENLDSYSHLELESLPSGGWGYDHFPITARYARNLNKPIIGMTGKFHTYWGDFHSLKNKEALQFECFNMLALGAGCSIGDQLHPNGKLSTAAYDLIGSVYKEVETIEKDSFFANKPQTEIGLLTPEETWVAGEHSLRIDPSLIGANRLLQELNYQFDIIDSQMDFSKYKVIILPDVIKYSDKLEDKLKEFTKKGGAVLSTYQSLIKEDVKEQPFYGVNYLGDADYDRDFILPNDVIGKNLPKEEFVMYLKGEKIESTTSEVVLESVKSYFNREGETFCSHQHAPSQQEKGFPAGVYQNGVYYFSHPLFRIYRKNAARWIKEIIKDVLEKEITEKLLIHNGPSVFLTTVNQSEDKSVAMIHGLNYVMKKNSEDIYTIDEIIPLYHIEVKYYIGDKIVTEVENNVTKEVVDFTIENGYLVVNLEKIEGHLVLKVSFA